MAGRNQIFLNLNQWRDELAAEPAALGAEADPIVREAAEEAAKLVTAAYPTGPGRKGYAGGNLKRGVLVRGEPPGLSPAIAEAKCVSTAPHAHLYEYGTVVARAFPTFWPITEARGRLMLARIDAMVRSRGLQTSGTVD